MDRMEFDQFVSEFPTKETLDRVLSNCFPHLMKRQATAFRGLGAAPGGAVIVDRASGSAKHLAAINETTIPDVGIVREQNIFVKIICADNGIARIAGFYNVSGGAIMAFHT